MGIVERKERERQMRRDLILQASETVFFEKGLRAATLDEIAEKAEVSKGTIYLYFSSKEDLYYSLMTNGLSMLLKIFQDTKPEEKNTQNTLVGFSKAYFKFSQEQSYLFKMLAAVENPVVSEQVSPEVFSKLEEMSDNVLSYVAQFVQKGIEGGEFQKDISAYSAVILFWVSLSGILNLKARTAMMLHNNCINKNSVICGVDYDLLYDQCIQFLMNFLNADPIPSSEILRRGIQRTKTQKTLHKVIGKKKHGTPKHLKAVK